jgi:hypothetical protein
VEEGQRARALFLDSSYSTGKPSQKIKSSKLRRKRPKLEKKLKQKPAPESVAWPPGRSELGWWKSRRRKDAECLFSL